MAGPKLTAPSALRARCDLDALEAKAKAGTPGEWEAPDQPESIVNVWTDAPWHDVAKKDTENHGESTARNVFNSLGNNIAQDVRGPDAAFIVAAQPRVVLDLVRRLRAAEAIVRDVAKYPPVLQRTLPSPVFGGSELTTIECAFCHARDAINGRVIVHAESCPYRRAGDATRRES